MAIIGIGTDIVEIARISGQQTRIGDKLAKRVLTDAEFAQYLDHKQGVRFLAKRFAAKEAAAKALGTGIGRGVSFQHIHISNNEDGAPLIHFTDGALTQLQRLGGSDASSIFITIADEQHYAVATVVIEK